MLEKAPDIVVVYKMMYFFCPAPLYNKYRLWIICWPSRMGSRGRKRYELPASVWNATVTWSTELSGTIMKKLLSISLILT